MASKTKDRILKVSLALFNQEGEANVTSVDIANALEISPGNLYYHFKGKDEIIRELFNAFEDEMHLVLSAPIEKALQIEDNWLYLYIILEEIYDFRFFYRNIDTILHRIPELRGPFRRLLSLKEATIAALLTTLSQKGVIAISQPMIAPLSNHVVLILTYWLNAEDIRAADLPAETLLHKTVYQIMTLIAPYLGDGQEAFEGLLNSYYAEVLAGQKEK